MALPARRPHTRWWQHTGPRIGLFVGTSTSGILETEQAYRKRNAVGGALPSGYDYAKTHNTFSVAAFVANDLALDGPAVALSSACATTAKAFAAAARMIAAGQCDAAVVGGADTLCLTTLYGFHALGLLSTEPCRPFDPGRDGISIGEGAGFALVEKPGNETGDAILLLGTGESSDAYSKRRRCRRGISTTSTCTGPRPRPAMRPRIWR